MTRCCWIVLGALGLAACGAQPRRGGAGGGGGGPGRPAGDAAVGEGEGEAPQECPAPYEEVARGMSVGRVFPAAPFTKADGDWDTLYARCGKRAVVVVSAAPW